MPNFTHPMTAAMVERIKNLHAAISAFGSAEGDLEGDFLDLLDSLANNEGADAQRAALEAVDFYMDDQDGLAEEWDGPDPQRERFPTE